MAEPGNIKSQSVGTSTSASQRAYKTVDNRFNRVVKRASEMTEWNDHNNAIKAFTRYFKYDDLTSEMDAISREHERLGHMPQELLERRNRTSQELFDRIRNEYGEDTLRRVYKGL